MTCLDLLTPGLDGVAEPVDSFAGIGSRTSNQLFLEITVESLELAQFHLLEDHCLRLLDETTLHALHLEHHLIQTRVPALQMSIVAKRNGSNTDDISRSANAKRMRFVVTTVTKTTAAAAAATTTTIITHVTRWAGQSPT